VQVCDFELRKKMSDTILNVSPFQMKSAIMGMKAEGQAFSNNFLNNAPTSYLDPSALLHFPFTWRGIESGDYCKLSVYAKPLSDVTQEDYQIVGQQKLSHRPARHPSLET